MKDATSRGYYVAHQGRKFGPLSLAELASRRLSTDMLVWTDGRPDWVPITACPELRQYVHHAAAAAVVAPPSRPSGPATSAPGPPVQAPAAGAPPGLPPPPPRDGRLRLVSITTIVLAALGLLMCPLSMVGNFLVPDIRHIAVSAGLGTTTYLTVWTVLYAIFFFVSIAMLAAGVGLLKRRRWAALTSSAASITCLIAYVITAIFQTVFVILPVMSRMNADDSPTTLLLGSGVNGIAVAMLVGFVWHITSLAIINSATSRSRLR